MPNLGWNSSAEVRVISSSFFTPRNFYLFHVSWGLWSSLTGIQTEAATRGVIWKKLFLEILQNLQENTYMQLY